MQLPLIICLALLGSAAHAQPPDSGASKDPQERARVRTEGAAGGLNEPIARGDRTKSGMDAKAAQKKGRVHDERSSDRKAGRGADGRSR
jgi:hypothetical protein